MYELNLPRGKSKRIGRFHDHGFGWKHYDSDPTGLTVAYALGMLFVSCIPEEEP